MNSTKQLILVTIFFLMTGFLMIGCSMFINSAATDFADNLSNAIINNDDPAMVEVGGPAYLLMIDGLLHGDPENESLLRSAATFYTNYATVFAKDNARAQKLTQKALNYAFRAVCVRNTEACLLRAMKFEAFSEFIASMNVKDVPTLYSLGSAWAGWMQAHSDDWNAVAEIPRVEKIMQRIVELDEFFQDGGAHLYLGIFATLHPPALGGKPAVGRKHFEKAIEISGGRNLMVKVAYARQYARLMFDRQLHDKLLEDVLESKYDFPGYTLINILARQQARELLDSAEDYF